MLRAIVKNNLRTLGMTGWMFRTGESVDVEPLTGDQRRRYGRPDDHVAVASGPYKGFVLSKKDLEITGEESQDD